ncbi:MAG TPA: ROK family protein [Acidimicrobiales bacterium]|jgi:polyphosphate glucokinase
MAYQSLLLQEQIFAIDIGATNIKFSHVNDFGVMVRGVRRRQTPYPCSPDRLVEFLEERIVKSGCRRVGIGFPGEFRDGHVIAPGNLSRPGGQGTDKDPELDAEWRDFPLQDVLRAKTGREVRVVNDATMAALGCVEGTGTEVVLALGTGLGLALAVDGKLTPVRDVGAEIFRDGKTYDESIGERARSLDEEAWNPTLVQIVEQFAAEFHANVVHLAGGNARRVDPAEFDHFSFRVVINGNEAPMKGAARLFSQS